MTTLFAEIILPLPLEAKFTYAVPAEMVGAINVGHRVIVPFGKKKYLTGIVDSLTPRAPEGFEVKEIASLLDKTPIVRHPQLKMWAWIADYYMCGIGDVYKAAIPAGMKIESETYVEVNPDYDLAEESEPLTQREAMIVQLLDHEGNLPVADIEKMTGLKNVVKLVNDMVEKGVLVVSEKLIERYTSKKITMVRSLVNDENRAEAFKSISRSEKQEKLLLALLEMSRGKNQGAEPADVPRDELLKRAGVTTAVLQALSSKGLAEIYKVEINRFKFDGEGSGSLPLLTAEQQLALDSIVGQWADKSTVLLHGVTSSGKTEIYSHLIDRHLNQGNQVLYLVPEIALTTQLTQRLQRVFGNRVVVYHSKFSDNERVDIWNKLLNESKPWVIVGARSSLFLPFSRLGLVIVDEEHESSYKQSDPAPRYNARDVALLLASMHGAKTLLGSATPSIETYYKALNGKFGLVSLTKRYNDLPLPPIKLIDMTTARKKQAIVGPMSTETIKQVNQALDSSRQAIIFRNRRGFAPLARCKQCAWIPKCRNCDVTLTYHRHSHRLLCHYCGTAYPLPDLCPQCGQPSVEVVGYGTERVEEEIENIFPGKKVLRMDLDTTRNKENYESIIQRFSQHKADILVGTQMVTKGLDFKDVTTVAVLNADELINFPDFKSSERAFNMLEQVSGRAGRHDGESAQVIVQTYSPEHKIFPFLLNHNYIGFYNTEIEERRQFNYPPFSHIIYIYLKHRDSPTLQRFSNAYAEKLRYQLGNRVQGPDQPKIARIKSLFIQNIMIKIENGASLSKVREILRQTYREMAADPTLRTSVIYYDVDP